MSFLHSNIYVTLSYGATILENVMSNTPRYKNLHKVTVYLTISLMSYINRYPTHVLGAVGKRYLYKINGHWPIRGAPSR